VTLRTYCIPFLSKCQSWPHRCIWIFEADFVGDSFKNRLLTPHPVSPKKFITESPSAAIILEELCIFVILQKGFIREFCVLFGGGKNIARKWHTFVRSPEKNPKAKS
jgi:hypothetical protein